MNIYLTFLTFLVSPVATIASELARGFNDNINWVTFEDGKKLSHDQMKPLMLLIHKSWCGACKALKPQFATSKEIEKLSQNFIMVNVLDDEEPSDKSFAPDGGYIPRILFIDPSGKVLTEIINEEGNESYKYYYHASDDITKSMKQVLSSYDQRSSLDEL